MRLIIFTALLALVISSPALAVCEEPAGVESQTRYDFTQNRMLYCDGTEWKEAADTVMQTLPCADDQIPVMGTTEWECINMPANNPLPTGCASEQIPAWNGTAWVCTNKAGAPYTGPLASGTKNGTQCSMAGGTPYLIGLNSYTCYFPKSLLKQATLFGIPIGDPTCPDGWSKHANWSKTTAKGCSGSGCSSCTTGKHNFSNVAHETCTYRTKPESGGCQNTTCKADTAALGCI